MSIEERIDRRRIIAKTHEQAEIDDVEHWMSKTPSERIEALEYLRRWLYGDDQVDARLQRVFEFAQLGED